MWPFGERLKDQDAIEKYRRWLKRWLLTGRQNRQKAPGIIYPGGNIFDRLTVFYEYSESIYPGTQHIML